jgi:HD superfamily phosphodiesterase
LQVEPSLHDTGQAVGQDSQAKDSEEKYSVAKQFDRQVPSTKQRSHDLQMVSEESDSIFCGFE